MRIGGEGAVVLVEVVRFVSEACEIVKIKVKCEVYR